MDYEGRRDLKCFYAEAGNTVLNVCRKTPLGKWGWRKVNAGKSWLKVLCAIGHKLLTYAWHIMLEHPTPNRDGEGMFVRKLARLCTAVGNERLGKLGYETRKDFYRKMTTEIYGHLPKESGNEAKASDAE